MPRNSRPANPSPYPALDLSALPADALLTRKQTAALSGFTVHALRLWAREGRKGPPMIRVESYPRYRVADVRAWLGARP